MSERHCVHDSNLKTLDLGRFLLLYFTYVSVLSVISLFLFTCLVAVALNEVCFPILGLYMKQSILMEWASYWKY